MNSNSKCDLNKPYVSVLMGVFNCESTIKEAVSSIVNQTYDSWELIICDDGSTDGTYTIVRELAEGDSRIKVFKNENNLGLNKTLNKCLAVAEGKYIARMDGDDLCSVDRLEKEVVFLNNHLEYAIVSTQMHFFNDEGIFCTSSGSGEVDKKQFAKSTQIFHAPCMVRKEAFETVGGYSEQKDRLRVEDWDLWIRMLEKGYRAYNLDEPLYSMRDDNLAYKRRKYKYRINEAKVSVSAVKKLKLPKWEYIYSLRPLIVGLLPTNLYKALRIKRIKGK